MIKILIKSKYYIDQSNTKDSNDKSELKRQKFWEISWHYINQLNIRILSNFLIWTKKSFLENFSRKNVHDLLQEFQE